MTFCKKRTGYSGENRYINNEDMIGRQREDMIYFEALCVDYG